MTRRAWLAGAASSALGAGVYPTLIEPRWFEVRPWQFPLFAGGPPVRLLHLSDLHHSWAVPLGMIEGAFALGLAAKPDLICVTGDFITTSFDYDAKPYAALLRRLAAAAPVYAVLGNHDGGSWARDRGGHANSLAVREILSESSVTLLHNAATEVRIRGQRFWLAGVGDYWSDEIDARAAFEPVPQDARAVLMSHNPDSKDVLGMFPWHLMLSGHTHGGQVVFPGGSRPFVPVRDLRYVEGLRRWGDRSIEVTRGVGNLGSVRLNCRPEVTLIDLT